MTVSPVVLEGQWVRLEPTGLHHAASLARHATAETFDYFITGQPPSIDEAGLAAYIADILLKPDVLSFAVIDKESGEAIGMSSYLNILPQHRGLEVGMTWYAPAFRGTRVNPESKLLLIGHAFDTLDAVRVQLKTDLRNVQSQRAIEKLGAVREGVLRHHMIFANGYVRDTVMYSILPAEWPTVRAGLIARLV